MARPVRAGLHLPELIDKLCMMSGCVFVYRPSNEWPKYRQTPAPTRIEILRIGDGEKIVADQLQTHTNDVIAGGIHALPDSYTPPSGGAGYIASAGLASWLVNEVPDFIDVLFPRYIAGSSYEDGQEASNEDSWQLGRWDTWSTSFGRPTGVGSYLHKRPVIADTMYARFVRQPDGSLTQEGLTDLVTRAGEVTTAYYDRFRAGACDILFRGMVPLVQWPGAQTIEWRLDPVRGPITRAVGELHHRLFGFDAHANLRPVDIQGVGGTRVMLRPDNGLTIDSRQNSTQRCYYGRITLVLGGPVYNAVAYDDPNISVAFATPLRMGFSGVDVTPAAVGDPCMICVRGEPDEGQLDLHVFTEGRSVTSCEVAAQPAGFFGMNKFLNAIGVTR